jgi:AcrR family transcriptional regulator
MIHEVSPLPLPARFNFAEFRRVAPIDEASLCALLLERNASRIGVKRRHTAEANLQAIFTAAFRLANRTGFHAMTLRQLCQEAGLSMGGLYAYLENKDALSAMIEDVIRYICQGLPEWFAAIEVPLERAEAVLRGHLYLSEMLQPWFFFVYMESRSLPEAQRKQARTSELGIEAQLAQMLRADSALGAGECQLLAAHALAMVQDWHLKRWKYKAAGIGIDAFADSVVGLLRARIAPLAALPD